MVFFVMARPQGGGSYFPGRCQFESMTEPLQNLLGNRYEDALASIVGVTDREKIIELLSGEIPPQSAQPAILNPEDAGSELLDGLTKTSIAFDVPASWTGPYTICTKIEEGWNDCMALSHVSEENPMVDAYLSSSYTLSVWLLTEDADLLHPLQLLGDVSLKDYADLLADKSGAVIKISLEGDLNEEPAAIHVSSPDAKAVDGETWDVLLRDSGRMLDIVGVTPN